MITHTIDQFILEPKSKQEKNQSYKFKEFAKTLNFVIVKKSLARDTPSEFAWYKICKYQMDLASIVENTERARLCHRRTDGQTDGQGETSNPSPPLQPRWAGV